MPAKKFLNKLMLDAYSKNKAEIIGFTGGTSEDCWQQSCKTAAQTILTKLESVDP
jgi:hypothetical protein